MKGQNEKKMGIRALGLLALAGFAPSALADSPAQWSEPVLPFRIVDNVHYVGSKGLAAYLITSDQGAILLDATLPDGPAQKTS